jgi:hypothetical protein
LTPLPPEELRKLYQKAIDRLWDKKAYEKVLEQEALERAVLRDALAVSGFDNPVSKSIFLLEDSESPVKVRPSKGQIGVLMDKVHDLDFGG